MTRQNFEIIKQVLLEPIFETEEDAISGKHRRNADGKITNTLMEMIRYRNISPEYDSRAHFYSMGRALIATVNGHIERRQITPAFTQDWGVIMFCHGYIAAHFFDDSDDLSKRRGGRAAAKESSKDAQRVWIARLLADELGVRPGRKAAERTIAERVQAIRDRGGYPPIFPPSWFDAIVDSNGNLKSTYGARQMPATRLPEWTGKEVGALPPIET